MATEEGVPVEGTASYQVAYGRAPPTYDTPGAGLSKTNQGGQKPNLSQSKVQ